MNKDSEGFLRSDDFNDALGVDRAQRSGEAFRRNRSSISNTTIIIRAFPNCHRGCASFHGLRIWRKASGITSASFLCCECRKPLVCRLYGGGRTLSVYPGRLAARESNLRGQMEGWLEGICIHRAELLHYTGHHTALASVAYPNVTLVRLFGELNTSRSLWRLSFSAFHL